MDSPWLLTVPISHTPKQQDNMEKRDNVDFNTGLPCTETPIQEEKNLSPFLFSDTYVVTCEVAGKKGLTITSLQACLEL